MKSGSPTRAPCSHAQTASSTFPVSAVRYASFRPSGEKAAVRRLASSWNSRRGATGAWDASDTGTTRGVTLPLSVETTAIHAPSGDHEVGINLSDLERGGARNRGGAEPSTEAT